MSAKVYKPSSAVQIAAFRFPELGESIAPHAPELSGLSESFLGETVDFEPFIEVERKSPATVDEILQDAQAAQIIAQAEKDKEMIEQAAREKAEQEARAVIEAEVEERIREIRENLAQSMREVSALRDEISARVEKDVVELALEIAKKIVGREVMFDREIALTLVKVSLKKITAGRRWPRFTCIRKITGISRRAASRSIFAAL
jgi:flagellar biosynthesis/type III secretory pathway protein FliH